MRLTLVFVFLFSFCAAFAQERSYYDGPYSGAYDYDYEVEDYRRKYPYARYYTPSFFGLIAGYNFLKAKEVELGVVYNLAETTTEFGMTGGYQLVYKRSLERDLNAVDLEMGVYGLISLGVGANYTFAENVSAFGFKPFVGTSIYHFQLLYGYNIVRKKKQEWYQLSRHSLSLRYVIPLKANKQTYYYLPPAPNYETLPGLHKKHPVQRPRYGHGEIQLR